MQDSYTGKKAFSGYIDQLPCLLADLSHRMSSCGIGMVPLIDHACVQADDISLLKNPVLTGDPVNHFIVHRYANTCRITVVMQEIRDAAQLPDQFVPLNIYVLCGDTRPDKLLQFFMYDGEPSAGFPYQRYLVLCLDYDRHSLLPQNRRDCGKDILHL